MSASLGITVPSELIDMIAERVAELLAPMITASPSSSWLSVPEAADYLRCKPKRVYDLISQRRIPVHRDGGRVLLRRDELDRYLGGADTSLTRGASPLQIDTFRKSKRTVSSRSEVA